jgi:hypothetical protein
MLDVTVEPRFAHAVANLMQAYASAGTRIAQASADQGLMLWAGALRLTAQRDDARWHEWSRSPLTPWVVWASAAGTDTDKSCADGPEIPATVSEPAYASYRTSSGHATAQVIVLDDRRR